MLRLDFNLVLEMINLVVLFLLLRKFLIRPVMNIMEKRKNVIDEGLRNADDQQKKAIELKRQYEAEVGGAKEESLQLISRAKQDAKQEYEKIVSDANVQADNILETARKNIDAEREKTLREMKSEVAGLAMKAAEKIVEGQCSYDQFLKETGDSHEDRESN